VRQFTVRHRTIGAASRYYTAAELSAMFAWLPARCSKDELRRDISDIEAHGFAVSLRDGVYAFTVPE
jgi:hypothetical protein